MRMNMLAPLGRFLDIVIDVMNLAGTGLIALLVALVTSDVLSRNLFGAPIIGVPELVALSILAIVTLQLPYATRGGRLTQSDALLGMLPRNIRWALTRVFDLVALVVILAIVYYSLPLLEEAYTRGLFVGALGTFTAPIWPVRAILVVSMSVLALQFLRQVLSGPKEYRP
ncbi:TRAP transporter small permease subunit [Paracoccus thiocyanatus]|uniref:TRAP transporter small permease protein n=1 Tax=Paracoccus thiocyanatus TaxID=34006 RepID=A0A3D8PGH0_9RHOB|nr:TRAP transporter small permease [Paracoccus thiocyanatus]RDW14295.1 hypothetical protein DIE28_03205 [Paracoccus thiocyanatus]